MFFQGATIVLALVGFVSANGVIEQITHRNSNQLVFTGPSNYGLKSTLFSSLNWVSVSVNGNYVEIYTAHGCIPSKLPLKSLSDDKLKMIENARQQMISRRGEFIDITYQVNGRRLESERMATWNLTTSEMGEYVVDQYTESVYSAKELKSENGIDRVVFNSNWVTFVYESKQVQTKPIMCLEFDEDALVKDIQSTIKQNN